MSCRGSAAVAAHLPVFVFFCVGGGEGEGDSDTTRTEAAESEYGIWDVDMDGCGQRRLGLTESKRTYQVVVKYHTIPSYAAILFNILLILIF